MGREQHLVDFIRKTVRKKIRMLLFSNKSLPPGFPQLNIFMKILHSAPSHNYFFAASRLLYETE